MSFDVPNTFSSCCFDGRPSKPCAPWFDQKTSNADREIGQLQLHTPNSDREALTVDYFG